MKSAVILLPGLTLMDYDNELIPAAWPRIAVNSALRVVAEDATAWLVSDERVIPDYWRLAGATVSWWGTKDTARDVQRRVTIGGETKESCPPVAALEIAQKLGCERAFFFGLDCYRTRDEYYFDGGRPRDRAERRCKRSTRLRNVDLPLADQIYITDALKAVIEGLAEAKKRHNLWGMEVWSVASPKSCQKTITAMESEDFFQLVAYCTIDVDDKTENTMQDSEMSTNAECDLPIAVEPISRRQRRRAHADEGGQPNG